MENIDICPKTGKRHEPDWATVNVNAEVDTVYIDVNCKDCGRSGCVGTKETLEEDICW